MMRKLFSLLVFLVLALPVSAHAQGIERQKLRFAPGATQAAINGVVAGRQTIDYVIGARRGQTMSIRFQPTNSAAFFNLIAPDGQSLFVGQSEGNPGRFSARLGQSGDYAIRVYLVRAAARRGEISRFRLTVSIAGGTVQPQPQPEFPVADDGGPDFYAVAGLTPGDRLNMRAAPSAAAPVIARYRNGKILRNLGCSRTATQRWCRVENPDRRSERGFVNGRFLRESAAPGRPVRPTEEDVLVPGAGFNATGEVDCAIAGYPRVRSCAFAVRRGSSGIATVTIAIPDGGQRVLGFDRGNVISLTDVAAFRFGRSGDDYLINVNNGEERYTVPDAVINGG